MNNETAIKLMHVSKKYVVHHEKPTFMESVLRRENEEFWALRNINLEIKKGERVGLIGANGSGKTTLLKIITGITSVTQGKVETRGKLVSLIDLEAGFHPDMTGIQNIFLNGMILGGKKKELEAKLPEIVAYADIGKFIDAPLFTYSSGMQLRLGFSVAISMDPDIVVLDEGLNAGDEAFQKKANKSIADLFARGKTILLASHWLDFVDQNCDRIINLKKGRIVNDGGKEVISKYKSQT